MCPCSRYNIVQGGTEMFELILIATIAIFMVMYFVVLPRMKERRMMAKRVLDVPIETIPTITTTRTEVIVSELLQHSRHAMPAGMVISRVRRSWPQISAQEIDRALALVTNGQVKPQVKSWVSSQRWRVYQTC